MVDQDSDLADTFGFIVLKFFQFENRGSMRSLALFAALIGSRYPGVGRDDFPPAIARTGRSTWKFFLQQNLGGSSNVLIRLPAG